MALPYRLCAIDLDDTLLGPDHAISDRNYRAVRAAVEKGVVVVIASGRMHESTLKYVSQLQLDTPIISYNGAMVKSATTADVWLHEHIEADLAGIVMDYCEKNNLQLNYYLNDRLYSAAYTSWLKLYHDRTGSPLEITSDFYTSLRGTTPTKLIIVDSPEKTDSLLPYFKELFDKRLYVTKSNDEYLEFMPPEASKAKALALVSEWFGVPQPEVIAFGDSYNDIPMIKWAGLGVAVGNAKPELLAVADKVILSSKEDGVGIALDEIFELK